MTKQSKQKAHDALLDAIATKAKGADVTELGTLATAFQQVVHGPQGGGMHYQHASTVAYDYTATTEQTAHTHTHAHDPTRNGVGF